MKNYNPLLTEWTTIQGTPPFREILHDHYIPAIEKLIEAAREEVDVITNHPDRPTFENTIKALEISGKFLHRATSVLFNLNSAETNDTLQSIAREVSPRLSEFHNYVSLNETLFQRVKSIYENREQQALGKEDFKLLENTWKGFVRNGANLEGTARERLAAINTELARLTLQFGENVLADTNDYHLHITDEKDLSGLPDHEIATAAQLAGSKNLTGWLFNLQGPGYVAFMKFADNRKLREELFRAYNTRGYRDNACNNLGVIRQIVNLRLERARLLGYPNHAAYVLEERMAGSPDNVNTFLGRLHQASRPYALKELAEVTAFAQARGVEVPLERWDWSYWSEKLKNERYGFDEQALKPYFRLESVMSGVFGLANRLYGLTFRENPEIQVYHPDVTACEVFDRDGSFLAVLYLDFFPRDGKRAGAWMTEFRPQSHVDGTSIRPLISIVCNFTRPAGSTPSLLTFNEVTTFLHEFGHALHGMLANTTYESMSGTSVYRDFVELPSQVMENWATEKEFLDLFAIHYETGEKMPGELIQKLIASKNFQAGYACERQLGFGMTDMGWHSLEESFSGDIAGFEKDILSQTDIFPPVEGLCMGTAFSHIFAGGYAAGYYGYKWAEVLDADAFSLFKKNGIFDPATAESFRKNILEKGGTEHPMDLYRAFRGQEPSIKALLEREGLTDQPTN